MGRGPSRNPGRTTVALFWSHPDAACVQVDPEMFFDDARTYEAVAVCMNCPVMSDCADWSLQYDELHGVFAGLTDAQRQLVRKEQRDAC